MKLRHNNKEYVPKCKPPPAAYVNGRVSKQWPVKKPIRYTFPRGLYNPGNLCYRRSMLQCLLHLPPIYNHLGSVHRWCSKTKNKCIVCALQCLMLKYWHDRTVFPVDRKGQVLQDLDKATGASCPSTHNFFQYASSDEPQGDPHEYLQFIYEQLDKVEHHKSLRLKRLLNLQIEIRWGCQHCPQVSVVQADSMGLSLSISRDEDDVAGDLMDSLREYFAGDQVTITCDGENGCQSKVNRKRNFTIAQAPEVLVIHLQRTLRGYKERDPVRFPENLDLTPFNMASEPLGYQLYGVVGHDGEDEAGHYIAAVRHSGNHGFSTISDVRVVQNNGGTIRELRNLKDRGAKFDWVCLFYIKQ